MNIKIWDKEEKEWFNGRWLIPFFDCKALANDEPGRYVTCLGMGRNDKNGREIFEGDIVEVDAETYKRKFVIKFGKAEREIFPPEGKSYWVEFVGFYFGCVVNKQPFFSILQNHLGKHDLEITEVIGNIFENPELL